MADISGCGSKAFTKYSLNKGTKRNHSSFRFLLFATAIRIKRLSLKPDLRSCAICHRLSDPQCSNICGKLGILGNRSQQGRNSRPSSRANDFSCKNDHGKPSLLTLKPALGKWTTLVLAYFSKASKLSRSTGSKYRNVSYTNPRFHEEESTVATLQKYMSAGILFGLTLFALFVLETTVRSSTS